METDVAPLKEQLAQALFDHIPVGVGSRGIIPTTMSDLEAALELGMDYSIREARPTLQLTTAAVNPGNQSPTFPEASAMRLMSPAGLCVGGGQGALRGVRPHAERRPH